MRGPRPCCCVGASAGRMTRHTASKLSALDVQLSAGVLLLGLGTRPPSAYLCWCIELTPLSKRVRTGSRLVSAGLWPSALAS